MHPQFNILEQAFDPFPLNPAQINAQWEFLTQQIKKDFSFSKLTFELLFLLVGLREMGWGLREYTKDEKMILMDIGNCKILEASGYYKPIASDSNGWLCWELVKPLPELDIFEQAQFIRAHIIYYFSTIYEIT